jgi:hypothetical protein
MSNEQKTNNQISIEEGTYEAQCVGYKKFKQSGKINKLVLEWDFTLSGMEGVVLPQFYNLNYKTFKNPTKYCTAWVLANKNRFPVRRKLGYMSPKIFMNIVGKVTVIHSKPRFLNGKEKPEVFKEPVVSEIIEVSVFNNYNG